ncbi:MAG: DNA adenine methylase [Phycisphaerales bacterium]|nr:DNA adenine methylase [Planctomycetota bacterium]MCH8509518.1 DNA adenine methylase [Phycisphaerales bacterium]
MVKYLGSKRRLLGAIVEACAADGARRGTAIDLFSGTARVGMALKAAGWRVISNDHTAFAHVLATAHVQADPERLAERATAHIDAINRLDPAPGYITRTYCEQSRFFHPDNGPRIDAARAYIASLDTDDELRAVLLASLIEAADRVDSTTGVQMAYLKQWAPRAARPLSLRLPEMIARPAAGACRAVRMDALDAASVLSGDVAYLDPPYNQHSYLSNYHIWETLASGDEPEVFGIACKRVDCRTRKSPFNSKRAIGDALRAVLDRLDAGTIVLSFNDEGHLTRDQLEDMLAARGPIAVLEREQDRYVGCKIGIHNPSGRRVGSVGRLRNTELIFVAGRAAARLRDLEPVAA